MLDNLLLSLRTVLPVVLLICVGMFLKKIDFMPDAFYGQVDRFVFKVALPCMIFLQVATADISVSASFLKTTVFIVPLVWVFCILYCLTVPLFVKDRKKVGASVQSMFRSNVAILGVVLIENMFDDAGVVDAALTEYAVVMPFVVLSYNFLSVVVLAIFMPDEDGGKPKIDLKYLGKVMLETVKNPLIISVILGLPFMIFGIPLPDFAEGTIKYLSNTTTGLALISIGAGFSFRALRGNLGLASFVTAVKLVLQPVAAVALGWVLGFRGNSLMITFIVFGTPAAVSSYIMTKNMKSDHELSGQILVLTTVFCILTVFLGIFAMRSMEWI